jgi:hypothetical protein
MAGHGRAWQGMAGHGRAWQGDKFEVIGDGKIAITHGKGHDGKKY